MLCAANVKAAQRRDSIARLLPRAVGPRDAVEEGEEEVGLEHVARGLLFLAAAAEVRREEPPPQGGLAHLTHCRHPLGPGGRSKTPIKTLLVRHRAVGPT